MKQLILLVAMMVAGTLGSLFHPFWGVLLYYTLAVLRPQYLWAWALPPDVRWSLLAAGAVLLGLAVNIPRFSLRGQFNTVAGLMLGHSFFLLLSVMTAYEPDVAQNWGLEYAKIIVIAVIATFMIEQLWQVRAIALMVLLSIGYIAWEVNFLYLVDGRLDIFHYGFGGLDNNGAGLLLAMGIPMAYVFGVTAKRRWQCAGSWLIGMLMIHAVLMSYSRGAMLAVIVGATWLLSQHRPRWQAGAIAVVLCVAVPLLAGSEIRERFMTTADYQTDGSANSRFNSWSAAWQIACDYPITGQGIRNSNAYSQNYGADIVGRTIHSQYLQTAADSGIPAMLFYIAMLGSAIVFLGRSRRLCAEFLRGATEPKSHRRKKIIKEIDQMEKIALGCQASLIIFAFGGIFLSLEVFEVPWIFIVLAGVLPACIRRRTENYKHHHADEDVVEPAPNTPVRHPTLKFPYPHPTSGGTTSQ